MREPENNGDRELNDLFASYREACAPPDARADFMPRLWERIESRRRWADPLWRWANGLAAAAAAASLFIVLLQAIPSRSSLSATRSYVEWLAEEHDGEDLDLQLVSWSPNSRNVVDGVGR